MNQQTKFNIGSQKLESISQSAGDNIIAGIIIANILSDTINKLAQRGVDR